MVLDRACCAKKQTRGHKSVKMARKSLQCVSVFLNAALILFSLEKYMTTQMTHAILVSVWEVNWSVTESVLYQPVQMYVLLSFFNILHYHF